MASDPSARSRRALLLGAAGGLAAVAAQAMGRPFPARAQGPTPVYREITNNTTAVTRITNTSGGDAFVAGNAGSGTGLYGFSDTGTGVSGGSFSGRGVDGFSFDAQGVFGEGAIGVEGRSSTSYVWAVYGSNQAANGFGVGGEANHGSGIGVLGSSGSGRGGQFNGGKAQIRLLPSQSSTHPTSGKAGDLFLDASKRLWLCKGGATWVRVA